MNLDALEGLLAHEWSPTTAVRHDRIDPAVVRRLAATLDREAPEELPALWHWLAFLPETPTTELTVDGHPPRGGVLPPITLPRRMFAGGSFTFHQPVPIDAPLERRSVVTDVTVKHGRTGQLVFVTLHHELSGPTGSLVDETNVIAYREPAAPGSNDQSVARANTDEPLQRCDRSVTPTNTVLFRFSALTFNAHRIHYDRPYTREVEGYQDLVVHGPLIAMWLAEAAERTLGHSLTAFRFRSKAAAYLGDTIALRPRSGQEDLALTATAGGRNLMVANAR